MVRDAAATDVGRVEVPTLENEYLARQHGLRSNEVLADASHPLCLCRSSAKKPRTSTVPGVLRAECRFLATRRGLKPVTDKAASEFHGRSDVNLKFLVAPTTT